MALVTLPKLAVLFLCFVLVLAQVLNILGGLGTPYHNYYCQHIEITSVSFMQWDRSIEKNVAALSLSSFPDGQNLYIHCFDKILYGT